MRTFTKYFDCFVKYESLVNSKEKELNSRKIEIWFLFCVVWSIGGSLTEQGRLKFDPHAFIILLSLFCADLMDL